MPNPELDAKLDLRDYKIVGDVRSIGLDEERRFVKLLDIGVRLTLLGGYTPEFANSLGWKTVPGEVVPSYLSSLRHRICNDMGMELFDLRGSLAIADSRSFDPRELASILSIPEEKIDHWRSVISRLEASVRTHPVYVQAMADYNSGNQERLAINLPLIFPHDSAEVHPVNSPSRPRSIYHGVKIQAGETVDSYVAKLQSIEASGVMCSPPGIHFQMDWNIRPIYGVTDPGHTHGIAFFKVDLASTNYTVFEELTSDPVVEAKIYAPRLDSPHTLYLQCSPAEQILAVEHLTEISDHRTPEELDRFIGGVKAKLVARGVGFKPYAIGDKLT